jgi:autotransporter-associated beta strand protein
VIADQTGSDASATAGAGGLIIDGAGTVDLAAANSFTGGVTIDLGTLVLGNTAGAGSGAITFGSGDPPVLAFTIADAPANTIDGFVAGDTIDVTDMTGTAGTAILGAGETLDIPYNTGTLDLVFAGLSAGQVFDLVSDGASGTDITIPCYCRGTLILTERGEVAVEALRIGDQLFTHTGAARPIRWIGTRSYAGRFAAGNRKILPIRIAAGALADGVPKRDLLVSPEHALFLDGMLVPAIALVNGRSIVQLGKVDQVEYFHLELDSHDVILAEGAPAESFVDDDSRGMFHNAAEYAALYPDAPAGPARYCAPRVEDGIELEPLRRRLSERAGPSVAPPALRGWLDEATHAGIRGWAWDANDPDAKLTLEVFDSGVRIARVAADQFRGDLEDAGIGDGRHGFLLDAALSPLTHHLIEVRFADGGAALENGSVLLAPAQPFDDALAHAVAAAVDAAEEPGQVLDFLAAQVERVRQRRADAEAQRDARAAHLRSRRRWGTDPAAVGRRALVIADGTPPPLAELHALRQIGYAISIADAQDFVADGPDPAPAPDHAGVALCRQPAYASVEDVLRRQAGCFDLIWLPSPSAAMIYRALARQHCPRARILSGAAAMRAWATGTPSSLAR